MINILLLIWAARKVFRSKNDVSPEEWQYRKRQLLLATIFVLVVAFRSIVPRADVQRFAFFDSWIASVFVGRSLATIAEIAFIIQWVLLLRAFMRKTVNHTFVQATSLSLVPIIGVAEMWSWHSVITTSYFGNIVEESLWLVAGALLVVAIDAFRPRLTGLNKAFVIATTLLGLIYVSFMATVDVPMYIERWREDQVIEKQYWTYQDGVVDAFSNRIVTYDWHHWKDEMSWMSLYFTFGAWASIGMIFIPRPDEIARNTLN